MWHRMCVIIKFQLQHAISIKRIPINSIMSPASIIVLIDLLSLQLSTYCHVEVCWLWNTVCTVYMYTVRIKHWHTHIHKQTIAFNFIKVSQSKWLSHPIVHVVLNLYCDDYAHLLFLSFVCFIHVFVLFCCFISLSLLLNRVFRWTPVVFWHPS